MVAVEAASSPLEARCNLRGKCLAEYVFLGGSGGDLRSRTRVLGHVPASAAECPLWTVDGTYTDQVKQTSTWIVPYFMGTCAPHRNFTPACACALARMKDTVVWSGEALDVR